MILNSEFYLWFLLPTLIELFILVKSTQISFRRKTITGWVFTALILILAGLSETILYQIFFEGTWASFVPHLMIAFSIILFGLQVILTKQKAKLI